MSESMPSPALTEDEHDQRSRDTTQPRDHSTASLSSNAGLSLNSSRPPSSNTEIAKEEDDEYCEAPCKHHPISTKYPSSLDLPHVDNLHKFIRDVSRALKTSYPRTCDIQASHDKAHILFLRWEEDDLGTQSEIDELQPLMQSLRFTAKRETFTTEQYNIPSDDPQDSLEEILVSRRNKFAKRPRDLLVIYYGGHGEMSKQRQCIWHPWLNPPPGSYDRPEIDWTSLQGRLQKCEGDVVFILDCCYAASMVRGSHSAWNGFKELLVASGKHDKTEGVNDNSFTRSIIRELKNLKGKATSISGLQAALVENQEIHGLRNTPIRIGLSERANRFESLLLIYPHNFHQLAPIENLDSTTLDYGSRVLISIRLRNPANPIQVRDWLPWLQRQAPQDVLDLKLRWTNYVRPEAGFHHGSTLLFFSMPLTVWNVLPSDASYSFIDVIKSGNLIDPNTWKTNLKLQSAGELPTSAANVNNRPDPWPSQRKSQEDEDVTSTTSLEPPASSVAPPDSQSQKSVSRLTIIPSSGTVHHDSDTVVEQSCAAETALPASEAIPERHIQTDGNRRRLMEATSEGHFWVPLGRNENFVGRTALLTTLQERILGRNNTDNCQRTAIEGLGGIGKTQVALEAVYQMRDEHPDCSIFWVSAINENTFENDYRDIGRMTKIEGINQDKADVKLLVKTFLSSESSGYWLLVIDNADDVELLFGATYLANYLPFSRNGSILFTTRNHGVAVKLGVPSKDIITVSEMSYDEAHGMLQNELNENQISNTQSTKKLLAILANLPLAVRQASAYMALNQISTSEYIKLCELGPRDKMQLLPKDFTDQRQGKTKTHNPIATTWRISFEYIAAHNPLASEYLKYISLLAEEDIPKALLPTAGTLEAIEAIDMLKAYALITQRADQDSFSIHSIVRWVMRNWLERKGELRGSIVSAIERLDQVFPFPNLDNRDVWMRYLPHGQAALDSGEHATSNMAGARLLANIAQSYSVLGHYQVAEAKYRRALQLCEMILGKEDRGMVPILVDFGIVLTSAGKYEEAEQMLGRAIELGQKLQVETYLDMICSMMNLAKVLHCQRKFVEAEQMHLTSLELCEIILTKNDLATISRMNDLGNTLFNLGKYDKAEPIQRQAFMLKEETLGKDHPSTLSSMGNLALIRVKLGKYKEAESMYRHILQQKEKIGEANHPDTLAVMHYLALVLTLLEKFEESETMYRRVLKLRTEILGENHADTFHSMDDLARLLSFLGKQEESERMYRQALKLSTDVRGEKDPGTIHCLNDLALVLERREKYEEAEQAHRRTLELRESILGEDHPSTQQSRKNLADFYYKARERAGTEGRAGWMRLAPGMGVGMVALGLALAALVMRLNWSVKRLNWMGMEGGGETTAGHLALGTSTLSATLLSAPSVSDQLSHTGAILGGIVGGVIGLAAVFGVSWWVFRRKLEQLSMYLH